jgi:putative Holliday junction resolvase
MQMAELVNRHRQDERSEAADIGLIVVGVPKRLNGEDTDQTKPARDFAAVLRDGTGLSVEEQDERLSSHEADQRLAAREPDWRKRKAKLDAAAAAVILQDYLDARQRRGATA